MKNEAWPVCMEKRALKFLSKKGKLFCFQCIKLCNSHIQYSKVTFRAESTCVALL